MKRFGPLFYRLALANLLLFLGNSLYIMFPVFLKSMGASESYIGVMNNIDKFFIIITAVSLGSIMHHHHPVNLLRAGYAILSAAFASYLFITEISWIIPLIRILHGVGFSVAMILGTSIIFDSVPMEDATEAIGLYGVTGALSNALSPLMGETLLDMGYSYSVIFLLSILFVSGSFIITFFLPLKAGHRLGGGEKPGGSSLVLFRDGRFFLVSAVTLIFGGMFGVMITYLPNFVRTTTGFRFSWFFIVYIGVLIVIRFAFLGAMNRVNRNVLLSVMFVAGAASNLLLNFLHWFVILILVGVLYGVTHGVLYPIMNTVTVSIVPEKDRGRANALFTAIFNGGMISFSMGLGFLIDLTGTYLTAFNFSAAGGAAAIVLIVVLSRRYEKIVIPPPVASSAEEFDI